MPDESLEAVRVQQAAFAWAGQRHMVEFHVVC